MDFFIGLDYSVDIIYNEIDKILVDQIIHEIRFRTKASHAQL
jgi:hypothetical protein